MYEVKADALESSFETVERNGDVAALREEVSGLKRRLDQALVAGGRPVLGEAKADNARPEVKAFVDRYLRKGLERSEEHTSELQSLMRISYAVFCLKKKKHTSKTD